MSNLVMEIQIVQARRNGNKISVEIEGELANSMDEAYTEIAKEGAVANIKVFVRSGVGFGTQITGPFSLAAAIDDAASIKTVRVHGRKGVKEVSVA